MWVLLSKLVMTKTEEQLVFQLMQLIMTWEKKSISRLLKLNAGGNTEVKSNLCHERKTRKRTFLLISVKTDTYYYESNWEPEKTHAFVPRGNRKLFYCPRRTLNKQHFSIFFFLLSFCFFSLLFSFIFFPFLFQTDWKLEKTRKEFFFTKKTVARLKNVLRFICFVYSTGPFLFKKFFPFFFKFFFRS